MRILLNKIILLNIFICVILPIHAQMDIELQHLAKSYSGSPAYRKAKRLHHMIGDQNVVVIAQMDKEHTLPSSKLADLGVKILGNYGKVAILSVPVRKLNDLAELKEIAYLNTDHKCHLMNDSARIATQVDSLQVEQLYEEMGLDMPYDGSGVLAGIVDAGIDFQHAAFRDENGNTRIRMIQEYDTREGMYPEDMSKVRKTITNPEEISAHVAEPGTMSHGSHTACTMAGTSVTFSGGLNIQGMAPKAELLLSNMYSTKGETYDSYCMDAIFSQIQYAEKAEKPIVINNSYGDTSVFCDGKTAFSSFEESLSGPGRILCFSSGNSNNDSSCLEYEFVSDTDTLRTILYDVESFYRNGIDAYVVNEDSIPVKVELGCYDFINGQKFAYSYYSYEDSAFIDENDAIIRGNEKIHDNRYLAKIHLPGGYAFDEKFPYFISLSITGKQGSRVRVVYPEKNLKSIRIPGFTDGNGVNSFDYQCESDSVISVGSYTTKTKLNIYSGKTMESQSQRFVPSSFSSYGVCKYGKPIPDVMAPGEYLLSAVNAYDSTHVDLHTNEPIFKYDFDYIESFGRRSFYGWMRGTSMSCPVVAGIIALWLQANPKLSVGDIREVIQYSSIIPPEIEDYPSYSIGYGYINAARGLQYIRAKNMATETDFIKKEKKLPISDIYNLMGQKVGNSYKGMVIYNGRKIIKSQ